MSAIEESHRGTKRKHPPAQPMGHGHRRPFRRGDFKYILLRHLKEKPSYGYEIIRALEERFHSFYSPSPGSVYPTLQMLEEMGYVRATEKDGKKVYAITEDGKVFLEREKESEERIRRQMQRWWNPENTDDIMNTIRELDRLAGLTREKVRHADTEELSRIRECISHAYEEISGD